MSAGACHDVHVGGAACYSAGARTDCKPGESFELGGVIRDPSDLDRNGCSDIIASDFKTDGPGYNEGLEGPIPSRDARATSPADTTDGASVARAASCAETKRSVPLLRAVMTSKNGTARPATPKVVIPLVARHVGTWQVHSVDLSVEEQVFVAAMEPLWRRAHRIVEERPELDVSDVFHALRNLQRTPSERVRRAVRHGRARAHRT